MTSQLEDPYFDGRITDSDSNYLREYLRVTGKQYDFGDLDVLKALQECLSSDVPAASSNVPNVEEDRVCEQLARDWPVQYRLTNEGTATLSGCRQDVAGDWFFPTGPNDPRLPGGPILTPVEEQQNSQLRARILEQVEGLTAAMPPWMKSEVDRLYSPEPHAGFGHLDPDAATMGFQDQYAATFVSYLQDPNNVALANYATWWGKRRQAALGPACTNVPPLICDSFRIGLRTEWAPWPWDLKDPFTLAEYLDWALANGRVPPSSVT